MEKNEKKITVREALRLHGRAARDVNGRNPGFLPAVILNGIVGAAIPYVTIWLSAQIINELAGIRREDVLLSWVCIAIMCEAGLGLLRAGLNHWENAKWAAYRPHKNAMFTEKMLSMDYGDMDRQEIRDLYTQIKQSEGWGGWGLNYVPMYLNWLVDSITGILAAVILSVTLFTQKVPVSAGRWIALNHPLCIVGILAIMLFLTWASSKAANWGNAMWAGMAEASRFGNRAFGHFTNLSYQHDSQMDFRMYRQIDMAESYMENVKVFGVGSENDRLRRGPMGLSEGLYQGFSAIFIGVAYLFVCLKAWAGAFGVGSVTQYVGAITAMSGNVSFLFQTIGHMQNNAEFLKTTYEYLDLPNSMYQGSLTTEKRRNRQYQVEFRDVSFHYPGSELWALRHVNLKFQVGKRLAVVGENGSGKTTFIKLLCRLYDPQEGQILLNGIDIRKYNYRDYMGIFSVVFQDFQLVSQPLGANVAGQSQYDRDQVEKCLMDAGFEERLKQLPQGLDTFLYKEFGEDGIDVSGGEAQKIAIARALYKDAPFIILDEPTAALDPLAEAEIYSKFNDIAGDKTAIYISHRLSSCKFCDEIAVFHEGAVIQKGSHEELVADESGKYHELWHAQAQYYVEETGTC